MNGDSLSIFIASLFLRFFFAVGIGGVDRICYWSDLCCISTFFIFPGNSELFFERYILSVWMCVLIRGHPQMHLLWDSRFFPLFSKLPPPGLLSGLSKKLFESLILQLSIWKMFVRWIKFKAKSRCSFSSSFN